MTTLLLSSTFVLFAIAVASVPAAAVEGGGEQPSCQWNGHDISTNGTMFELILKEDYETIDDVVPECIDTLKEKGAHRCWHKHSTFLEHLVGTHNILRLWNENETMGRLGLFHSAYSNSYVNLALFRVDRDRHVMRDLVGDEAEELVYLYCSIDRQAVVVNTLLKDGCIPSDGMSVPHLRDSSQQIYLSPETLRQLVVFTMADISDQYFGWQDMLFGGGGNRGSMVIPGMDFGPTHHDSTALWPGISKPGLWMSYVSHLCQIIVKSNHNDPKLNYQVPPVFGNCSATISVEDDEKSIGLYWDAISMSGEQSKQVDKSDTMIQLLNDCIKYNPWAFEPYVLLGQKYLHRNDFQLAREVLGRALRLQQMWGTAWDKRMSFPAWVAWTRVLYQRCNTDSSVGKKDSTSKEGLEPWPANSWDVNNFGLVA